jgi:uncharacterized membrane protein
MNHSVKFDTNLIRELLYLPLNDDNKVFERFPNTVVYTPIPYVPQVLAILVGKSFNASPLAQIYFARIANLFFFLGLAYLAIKKTPVHKWAFCLLCLTPTNAFQVASASVDAFTYGICFLTIAYFLYYAFGEPERLEKTDIAKLFALSLLAVLCKQAYVFLPLLFLLIPRRKFASLRAYLFAFSGLMAACFGSLAAWTLAVKPIFLPYRVDIPISPDEQAAFIVGHPFNFLKIAVTDYVTQSGYYFTTFFGQLVWLDLYVPTSLTIIIFIVLMMIALMDKDPKIVVPKMDKTIFLAIITGTLLLISALLYMSWSPIRGDKIEGIQGRYFIPVAPLFFLLFYNKRVKWKFFERYVDIIVYLAVIVSMLVTLNSIVKRYYV